tara:strand:+ start:1434 stop:2756 length:1323 start_codon:yes stop_codon:yes gene_type:complete
MIEAWDNCLLGIKKGVSEEAFERWFKNTRPIFLNEKELFVEVPDSFCVETITNRFSAIIEEVVSLENSISGLRFVPSKAQKKIEAREEGGPEKILIKPKKPKFLNPKYTFDSFVVGASNEFAHACSLQIIEDSTKNLNPLFIYGGVGLGKTHLLHAIGHQVLEKKERAKVFYTSSENFINDLISSIQKNKMVDFRSRYRKIDYLLIDDIQFIAGKERTQEEFFFTFNALHESGKQIIMTSDKNPKDTPGLAERLKARFVWGIMADIGAPDFETKVAIIQKKASELNFDIQKDVAHFIAEKVRSNIRELEGCLVKLVFHSSLHGTEINIDDAKEILKNTIRDPQKGISIDEIQKIVAEFFQVRVSDLKSKNRSRIFAEPRQIAMYLSRKLSAASTTEIGARFGGKDHSTVIHSTNKITRQIKENTSIASTVNSLIEKIESL